MGRSSSQVKHLLTSSIPNLRQRSLNLSAHSVWRCHWVLPSPSCTWHVRTVSGFRVHTFESFRSCSCTGWVFFASIPPGSLWSRWNYCTYYTLCLFICYFVTLTANAGVIFSLGDWRRQACRRGFWSWCTSHQLYCLKQQYMLECNFAVSSVQRCCIKELRSLKIMSLNWGDTFVIGCKFSTWIRAKSIAYITRWCNVCRRYLSDTHTPVANEISLLSQDICYFHIFFSIIFLQTHRVLYRDQSTSSPITGHHWISSKSWCYDLGNTGTKRLPLSPFGHERFHDAAQGHK